MQRNENGEKVAGTTDLVALLSDPNWNPNSPVVVDADTAADLEEFGVPKRLKWQRESELPKSEFDMQNQSRSRLPTEIAELRDEDIMSRLFKANTWGKPGEDRIVQEYTVFLQSDWIGMLRTVLFFADECRKRNLLTGIGRGSSTSSYILYLLGIHKVDPMKYGLDFSEFAKPTKEN